MNNDQPLITRRNGSRSAVTIPPSTAAATAPGGQIDDHTMDQIAGLSPIEQLMALLRKARNAASISDIHIGVDDEPWITMDNEAVRLPPLPGLETITPDDIQKFVDQAFSEGEKQELHSRERNYASTSKHDDLYGTVRIHAMHTTNGLNLTIRLLSQEVPTFEGLGLPQQLRELADYKNGLIIFTGATGSGKSTSVAALINLINERHKYVIYCLEDPIEYIHTSKSSRIRQLAMHKDIPSYHEGLRSLLRTAPHVIFVGEMRDSETMKATIAAAETSHLVISTMHTNSPAESIQRLVGSFDAAQAKEIQNQFAYVMRAIVGQRIVPRADGCGRVVATELMFTNNAIRANIVSGKLLTLQSHIEQGREYGMHTLESELTRMVSEKIITSDIARQYANDADRLRLNEA